MKLFFKQRAFSWFDSYDIYGERGEVLFRVKGEMAWGHKLKIFDGQGKYVGTVREKKFTWMPQFKLYVGEECVGCLRRKFRLFGRKYVLDFNDWEISGNIMGWDYTITDGGEPVATIGKQLLRLTDTYVIDVFRPENALYALMVVLSIDAELCRRG